MKIVPFIAQSAADAVAQVRDQLGPDAVIVNVRRLPAPGLARLWQHPRIEVLAYVPEPPAATPGPLDELRQEISELKQRLFSPPVPTAGASAPAAACAIPDRPAQPPDRSVSPDGWRVGPILESAGFLPVCAQKVVERLRLDHGAPPASLAEQLMLTRQALCDLWPAPPPDPEPGPRAHLFVGAPGVGKTTCLLKWLAQAVLLGSQPARVRRLDGPVANMAESLSVFGEILGVPVERGSPDEAPLSGDELLFLDVPGVAAADTGELERMHRRLQEVDNLEIHLVLNAAYESSALQAHARAFSRLPLRDLIVTHLDEEGRWGKLWNLVLGTNYTIRFLSSGQNIPGEFQVATAERMVSRLFH